ncbi:MAG: DUF4838 domain-containing protein [Oligosphaeraceae bacterium]|nr:DUF4838 domain-containing protein [Oligosphaeraceae bacterium]
MDKILVLWALLAGILLAEPVNVRNFKSAISSLPEAKKSAEIFFQTAPALKLDGRDLDLKGGTFYGHGFYIFGQEARGLMGKTLLFTAKAQRREGAAPLGFSFRLFGDGNKYLGGRSVSCTLPNIGQWEDVSLAFTIPEMEGLENINVQFGFRQDGTVYNLFIVDEPSLSISEDGGLLATPGHSLGVAHLQYTEPLPLVQNGKLQFKIILAEKANPLATYAAAELQEHVLLATGEKPEISRDQDYAGTAIWIGDTALSRKYGVAPELLAPENWVVGRVGKAVILSGGERDGLTMDQIVSRGTVALGTLSATYEFLERCWGCRWYWPGKLGQAVPKTSDLSIERLFATGKPAYSNRSLFYDIPSKDPDVSYRDTVVWHRRIRIGGSEPDPIGMHSFRGWATKFADHPEYFALQADGTRKVNEEAGTHLCLTNPAVVEEAAKEKIAEFKANPRLLFASVMPGDSNDLYFCRCEACQKTVSAEKGRSGKHSNAVWAFVNAVAAKVAMEMPGRYIKCCAYADYCRRPDFALLPNIAVTLCYGAVPQGSLSYKLPWREFIDEWRQTGAQLYIWEYWNNSRYSRGVYGAPAIYPRQLQEIYAMDRGQVKGRVMELSDINAEGEGVRSWADWMYDSLNLYIGAKLMWNPDLDVQQELELFYRLFYGPAAAEMQQFYDQLELAWLNSGYQLAGKRVWDWEVCWKKTYPREFVQKMMGHLQQAVQLCEGQEPYLSRAKKTLQGYLPFDRNSQRFSGPQPKLNDSQLVVPAAAAAPQLDGVLSDGEWSKAAKIGNFTDSYHVYAVNTTTEIHLLYDQDYLYLAAQANAPDDQLEVLFAPADSGRLDALLWNYEGLEFFLAGADEECYQFIISPDNLVFDAYWPDNNGKTSLAEGMAWNSGVQVVTKREGKNWTLEAAIPRAVLKFSQPLVDGAYRVNFARNHYTRPDAKSSWKWEQSIWLPTYGAFRRVEKFGRMTLK